MCQCEICVVARIDIAWDDHGTWDLFCSYDRRD